MSPRRRLASGSKSSFSLRRIRSARTAASLAAGDFRGFVRTTLGVLASPEASWSGETPQPVRIRAQNNANQTQIAPLGPFRGSGFFSNVTLFHPQGIRRLR